MPKKFSEKFFHCIVISKNKLEVIELFGYISSNCQDWDLMSPEILMGPAYFSPTMIWSSLGYLMPKKIFRNFFRCRVISKNKLEIIEPFGDIYQIVKIETPFLQN